MSNPIIQSKTIPNQVLISSLILSFLLQGSLSIQSQAFSQSKSVENPYSYSHPIMLNLDSNQYLKPLVICRSMKEDYLHSARYKYSYFNIAATLNSYVGNYEQCFQTWDSLQGIPIRMLNDSIKNEIRALQPLDAVKEILLQSASRKAVFFNEAHFSPQTRVFITALLKPLYDQGYRYLASELVYQTDTMINIRKYPIIQKTGFYTNEPYCGDLIRTALDIGFTVLGYEDTEDCNWDPKNPTFCIQQRETNQAKNIIAKVYVKDPNAKLIVHAGWQHIEEKKSDNGISQMALVFKNETGIDPLTIEQGLMIEHSSPAYEQPAYLFVLEHFRFDRAVVFKKQNQYWVDSSKNGSCDMQVFHPRTKYISGQPDWAMTYGQRKLLQLPGSFKINDNSERPILIQAFRILETENPVPVSQIEITKRQDNYFLALPAGRYMLRAVNVNNKVLQKTEVQVR